MHYERALELWDTVDPAAPELSRIEVMQHAAEAALVVGHIDRAIALARDTLDRVGPDDPVAVSLAHERLGRYLWAAGRGEEALPEYQRAVALMPKSVSRERALVLAAEAQVLTLCNFNERSEPRCEEALEDRDCRRRAGHQGTRPQHRVRELQLPGRVRAGRGERDRALGGRSRAGTARGDGSGVHQRQRRS